MLILFVLNHCSVSREFKWKWTSILLGCLAEISILEDLRSLSVIILHSTYEGVTSNKCCHVPFDKARRWEAKQTPSSDSSTSLISCIMPTQYCLLLATWQAESHTFCFKHIFVLMLLFSYSFLTLPICVFCLSVLSFAQTLIL